MTSRTRSLSRASTLYSQWTAGADGYRGGQGLEQRHPSFHAAAADQYRLQSLGNAVSANLFRAVARHESDDQPTRHRNRHDPEAEDACGRGNEGGREARVEGEIGDHADELDQNVGGSRARRPDHHCHRREQQYADVAGEVGQFVLCQSDSFGIRCHVRDSPYVGGKPAAGTGTDVVPRAPCARAGHARRECARRAGVVIGSGSGRTVRRALRMGSWHGNSAFSI